MAGAGGNYADQHHPKYYNCGDTDFFVTIAIVSALVLFAGLMSGLTLGLMSMSLVDLEVLAKSGTPRDRICASKILPVVKRQHLLLCTLLISNAAAMEALPIFLDDLVPNWVAILVSVTLILLFGEIVPQSVCSKYGLVIGAAVAPIVRVLVWVWFPVAYPLSKLLDFVLGNGHEPLFRRAELKTLAGKGGELSHDETTIIAGALELTEKTARHAMTPLSETFAIDINAKLDRDLINLIMETGHSRVPVYYEQPKNIIGLILVKNLLFINPEKELPVKNATIRRIPRVSEDMPLYDILNEFQKGLSHMAVVVKRQNSAAGQHDNSAGEVRVDIDAEKPAQHQSSRTKRSLKNLKNLPVGTPNVSRRVNSKSRRWSDHFHSEVFQINDNSLPTLAADGEVVGIITMEDVMEELLTEEIYDETDLCDGH